MNNEGPRRTSLRRPPTVADLFKLDLREWPSAPQDLRKVVDRLPGPWRPVDPVIGS